MTREAAVDPKLSLRVERLTELTAEELHGLGGARAEAAATTALRECLRTVFGCTTFDTCPREQ